MLRFQRAARTGEAVGAIGKKHIFDVI
jgi:hypothetical protein